MGFLIGKVNETLQEFETTNQTPVYDSFLSSERSIDKTAHAYSYKEKGAWSYEMQFFSDTVYQNLMYLLNNRSSLREGMIMLPIPYSLQQASCILTPAYGTTNKAYYGRSVDGSTYPWSIALGTIVKTELSESDYGKIGANDANYIYQDTETGIPYYIFQFDLTNFNSNFSYKELRRLTLGMMGMNSSPVAFYVWSPSKADWYLLDEKFYYNTTDFDSPGTGTFSLNKSLVTSLSLPWGLTSIKDDFLDGSNIVTFMVAGADLQLLMCQYIRLFVNGYWVMANGVQDLEKYSTAFTGAGRTGSLDLMEI
jgi:hypothetical protein